MGKLAFSAMLREGSSGQIILTVPSKYRGIISTKRLVHITISNKKEDFQQGEIIEYD